MVPTCYADSIPTMFSRAAEWRVGVEATPSWVVGSNNFLRGQNNENKRISKEIGGSVRAGFKFNPETRESRLYHGVYQGIGVGVNGFIPAHLLGTPVSLYAYQGAPIHYFTPRFSLDYEWQFGAAFGWKHYDKETAEDNGAVGSSVTAHMGIRLGLSYLLNEKWALQFGLAANHYSNGNTSWPNSGVNTIGAYIGISYFLNPQGKWLAPSQQLVEEADSHKWYYDILAYGAWRKRSVVVGNPSESVLCPGKFGIAGLQFAPLYTLNRWVGIGPALDLQWDEGAGLAPYWAGGFQPENIRFERPPFGKQISAGVSAHAELTMPIFSVNVGLGYDFINPKGNRSFVQSLTLKTFISKNIFLNTGYRLGNFRDPQNLMLGIGLRL